MTLRSLARTAWRWNTAIACLAGMLIPSSLIAQVQVRAMSGGYGVPGADVQLWTNYRSLGHAVTDFSGVARIPVPTDSQPSAFLSVRRLGFLPARVPFEWARARRGDTVVVELIAVPAALPALVVRERKLRCPRQSEPAADSLWRRAAAHYASDWQKLFFGYEGAFVRDEFVQPSDRGFGPALDGYTTFAVAPDDIYRLLLATPPPYGALERHVGYLGEYWKWRYAPLQHFAAGHFTTEAFRSRHVLTIMDSSSEGIIIGFCPRMRDDTDIRGELTIGSDELFKAGRWDYLVSHDKGDDAGAEAVFGTTVFESRIYLVAVQGSQWRHDGRVNYKQDRFVLASWRYGHSKNEVRRVSREQDTAP